MIYKTTCYSTSPKTENYNCYQISCYNRWRKIWLTYTNKKLTKIFCLLTLDDDQTWVYDNVIFETLFVLWLEKLSNITVIFFSSNVFNIGLKKHFPVLNIRPLMFEPHAIIILELVPSIVIFWTYLNCWRKSYSNKATLLLGVCPRYKYYAIVITIELTVKKYSSFNWQWIFYFLRRCFLCCITAETFTGLDCLTRWVSYKKQELLTLREHLTSPLVLWLGQCCSSFHFCMLSCCVCLRS